MCKILDYIADNGQATDAELEELLAIKHTRVYNLTREMKDLGLIYIEGRGRDRKYRQLRLN